MYFFLCTSLHFYIDSLFVMLNFFSGFKLILLGFISRVKLALFVFDKKTDHLREVFIYLFVEKLNQNKTYIVRINSRMLNEYFSVHQIK